jgi:hypothetical protein
MLRRVLTHPLNRGIEIEQQRATPIVTPDDLTGSPKRRALPSPPTARGGATLAASSVFCLAVGAFAWP